MLFKVYFFFMKTLEVGKYGVVGWKKNNKNKKKSFKNAIMKSIICKLIKNELGG